MKTILSIAFVAALLATTIWLVACGSSPADVHFTEVYGSGGFTAVVDLENDDQHAVSVAFGTYYREGATLPGGVTDAGVTCYVVERLEYQGISIGAGAVDSDPVCDEAFGPFRLGAQRPLQPVGYIRVE